MNKLHIKKKICRQRLKQKTLIVALKMMEFHAALGGKWKLPGYIKILG